jgi:hypothetical protein
MGKMTLIERDVKNAYFYIKAEYKGNNYKKGFFSLET